MFDSLQSLLKDKVLLVKGKCFFLPQQLDSRTQEKERFIYLFIYLYTYLFIASLLDVLNVIFWIRHDHAVYHSELFFGLIS